jgi:hypothetical protein
MAGRPPYILYCRNNSTAWMRFDKTVTVIVNLAKPLSTSTAYSFNIETPSHADKPWRSSFDEQPFLTQQLWTK